VIGRLAKAALVFTFTSSSPAFASEFDNQGRFLGALALLEEGRADEGVDILRALYTDAPTPRVRLEFARALLLTEQWQEARQLFLEAFKDDPPPVVRANILSFISLIDRRKGKLSLSASVARYGNPLQQPGAYTLNFAGIELAYEPESIYRNLWGVNVGADFSKEFSNGWQLTSSAAYRDLQFDAADRFIGDVSFSRGLVSDPKLS
jgi:tetratricopeptide (TPR) repeat protein